jgi:hypothetical protein
LIYAQVTHRITAINSFIIIIQCLDEVAEAVAAVAEAASVEAVVAASPQTASPGAQTRTSPSTASPPSSSQ